MATYRRHSPVAPMGQPAQTESRNGWDVVLQYQGEGNGPHLIDLSHRSKWDIQDTDLEAIQPLGLIIPKSPGGCVIEKGLLVSRMNQSQAAVWQLLEPAAVMPEEGPYTDITEALTLLALVGKEIPMIMEKITSLDLAEPARMAPFFLQGPVLHVPCQLAVLRKSPEAYAILIACSRGYGQSMAAALLEAGSPWDLRPGGEKAFMPV
jgi:hypothetical protein